MHSRYPIYSYPKVTKKLMLNDRFGDTLVDCILEHHTVQDWILKHPKYMYSRVYCYNRYKLKPLELTADCINLLKAQLEKYHPELLAEIEYRKNKRKTRTAVGINLKKA